MLVLDTCYYSRVNEKFYQKKNFDRCPCYGVPCRRFNYARCKYRCADNRDLVVYGYAGIGFAKKVTRISNKTKNGAVTVK